MHVVAVTRAEALAPDLLASRIATITSREPSDIRLVIPRPLPWLVATTPDAEQLAAIVQQLRNAGLGAVGCAIADAQPWSPPDSLVVAFEDDALSLCAGRLRVPHASVRAIVIASLELETSREHIEHVVVSRNPRNLPRTMPVSSYRREQQRERVAILVRDDGGPNVRLAQSTLRAPAIKAMTSFERFDRVLEALRERIPHAVVDERLLENRVARSQFSVAADGRTSTTSNARDVDVVAHLLGRAWIENQIDT